jgi:pimeloyl-ACP methyl ester carboxylesterase/DNA-binding CsgD family transcriptional regulator
MRPVRFAETRDGLSLAWTRTGSGPPLVKAASWLTHLEYDAESPVWSHWVRFLEGHFDYLRYDERGCGLSDRKTGRLDIDTWTDDLERIVDAADMPRPFTLLAMSQGTAAAVAFAARHPADVSGLILCGGYARGVYHRGNAEAAQFYDAIIDIFRIGWNMQNPAFRDVFTRRFVQDGDPAKIAWFNDLCRRTTSPEIGADLMRARAELDITEILPAVQCPTLVFHAEGDGVAPLDEGRLLARRIPGAELVVLPSANHILQEDEAAWRIFREAALAFAGLSSGEETDGLTPREREILTGICDAKSNKEIARDLDLSDKTVRNHLTSIFEKLGVSTRQEAIVKVHGRR